MSNGVFYYLYSGPGGAIPMEKARDRVRFRIADLGLWIRHHMRLCSLPSAIINLGTVGLVVLAIVSVSSVGREVDRDEQEVPAFDEFLVIPERNMFSSRRQASRREEQTPVAHRFAATTAPATIEVIGIVKTSDSLSSIAIIKDHGRHVPCRVGDTVGGMLITEIRTSEIFFETASGTRIAKIQPGLMPDGVVIPEIRRRATAEPLPVLARSASGAGRRVPINVTQIRHLARTLPLVTHREEGRVKGLRLTQDVMGLREGDRVTAVGGQSLHTRYPKQKLLQMTRKYRQYGREIPEIPVVVERDDKKLELVLVPIS